MAIIIRAGGAVEKHTPRKWTLQDLQGVVGGYIELMPSLPITMFVNEDGRRLKLPVNHTATELVRRMMPHMVVTAVIVGDVILLERLDRIV